MRDVNNVVRDWERFVTHNQTSFISKLVTSETRST